MITVETISALRDQVSAARQAGKTVGFVPTMGNLHEGHLKLVKTALAQCDFVVASIFVNPMQFGPNEDLDNYPRTLAADTEQLTSLGCDLLFTPSVEEMYPLPLEQQSKVSVPVVSQGLCGGSRPGHFDGVSTVVNKLFNMVQPDSAFFGEKDFQQLTVIRKMVSDLCMPISIVGVATEREDSGLALSSRNGYLTQQERENIAPNLYLNLANLAQEIKAGAKDYKALLVKYSANLEQAGLIPDYLEIRRLSDLAEASPSDNDLVIFAAAYLGKARLIDNIQVSLKV